MAVKMIPDGYHAVTPYLVVEGAGGLIEFLKSVFGATVVERMERPDGSIQHAEVDFNGSRVMMGEPQQGNSPTMTAMLYVYVADCDSHYAKALTAGGKSLMAPADQFYGDRNAGVEDRWGNRWWIAEHKEDVSPEELRRRVQAMAK